MEADVKTQAELVDWLKSAAEKGGEFLEREAPLYAAEVIAWEFWSSVFLCIAFGVLGVSIGLVAAIVLRKAIPNFGNDKYLGAFILGIIAVTIAPFCLIASAVNGYYAVRAKVAPRVVLMEKIASGIKH